MIPGERLVLDWDELSETAVNFLLEVRERAGKEWAVAWADAFRTGSITHIAREGQPAIEGACVSRWRPPKVDPYDRQHDPRARRWS